jgi:hypothetical protein
MMDKNLDNDEYLKFACEHSTRCQIPTPQTDAAGLNAVAVLLFNSRGRNLVYPQKW